MRAKSAWAREIPYKIRRVNAQVARTRCASMARSQDPNSAAASYSSARRSEVPRYQYTVTANLKGDECSKNRDDENRPNDRTEKRMNVESIR